MKILLDLLKNRKKLVLIGAFVLCAVLVLSAVSNSTETSDTITEEEKLEYRLSELCERIDGVDKAYVMVSFSNSEDTKSYFRDSNGLTEYKNVNGVGVVCTGGDRGTVKREVSEMISAVLGIPVNRIKVLGDGH